MPGNPLSDPQWAPNLADTIDKYVATVRDKTTVKVILLVRAVVFGIIVAVAAAIALVLTVILATKLLQRLARLVLRTDVGTSVWVSYAVVGIVFTLLGFILMKKRAPEEAPAK